MKEKYLVLEWAYSYGFELCEAVRPTEEELKKYSDEYKPRIYFGVPGTRIKLDNITRADLPKRKPDGEFDGCGNQLYLISREEWDAFVALDKKRAEEKQRKEHEERIKYLKEQIAACEKQGKLYTKEEAKRLTSDWIKCENEGGEGYVPAFRTVEEYEFLKSELEKEEKK